MPEMPEVEQVRKTLAPRITNKKITSVEVYLDRLVKHPTVEKFVEGLTGKTILDVGRKPKAYRASAYDRCFDCSS